jgi:outer membrane immunogenic protein
MMKIFLRGFALVARNSRTIPDVGQESARSQSARSPRAVLIAGSMMKRHLLATVSGIVLMGAAQAADLPQAPAYKAAAVIDVPTWAGFYLGIQGGAARHDGSFNDLTGFSFGSPATFGTSKTGGLGGGYAGYNWQSRSFVYGVESDISWVGAKAESQVGGIFGGPTFQQSHDISWLATFRARAGLDVESTLVYLTGGLAVAQTKQSFNGFCSLAFACNGAAPGGMFGGFSQNNTQVGWTVGAGFEHMLDPHWTVRGEARYVDLGRSSVTCTNGAINSCFGVSNAYRGEFSNTLMTGMVGVGYKF